MVISLLSPALSACAKWQIRARGVERYETQPGEAGAWPRRMVVRELLRWGAVSSLKQRLIEREAWVCRLGRAWSLRSPVRENHAEISTVDDAVAVKVSATGEAVSRRRRWDLEPILRRAPRRDKVKVTSVVCMSRRYVAKLLSPVGPQSVIHNPIALPIRYAHPNHHRRDLRRRCCDDSRNVRRTRFGSWHHAVDDWVGNDGSCEERDSGSGRDFLHGISVVGVSE